jgi:hypothetical protein
MLDRIIGSARVNSCLWRLRSNMGWEVIGNKKNER